MQFIHKGINDKVESAIRAFAESVGVDYDAVKLRVKTEIALHQAIDADAEEHLRQHVSSPVDDETPVKVTA